MRRAPPAPVRLRGAVAAVAAAAVVTAALSALPTEVAAEAPAPLSEIPRVLDPGESLPCRELPLTTYRGTRLPYQRALRVHSDFLPRLAAFERIVAEVATRHYGRPPRRILHMGGFNCRRMRRYPNWVSEHALGNAVDVSGFDFGPLGRDAREMLPAGSPRALRRGFQVRVQAHWKATRGRGARHAAFLHDLVHALIAREDVFSVVLGPGWPGHHNHLHLDAAPYRVVEVRFPQGTPTP